MTKVYYNGLKTDLMDDICYGLSLRMDLKDIKGWETISLYLARTFCYLEKING